SDTMMHRLLGKHIAYQLIEEAGVTPAAVKNNRILFVHSRREHNVIINNPDDFLTLLENGYYLKKIKRD
ncbi:MAG TPA: hypothetical protein VHB48_04470, partial [Chitinophagaceae bacterium]|nr:hypothetical protein [Chitinophagaceae bacterium]